MFRSTIIVGVATTGLTIGGLFAGTGIANAGGDLEFLNQLRAAGVFIHKDAEPYVLQDAHHACRELHDGVSPDEVGASFHVGPGVAPAPAPQVYIDALLDNICPNALGPRPTE